jgi:hypothetical protein
MALNDRFQLDIKVDSGQNSWLWCFKYSMFLEEVVQYRQQQSQNDL